MFEVIAQIVSQQLIPLPWLFEKMTNNKYKKLPVIIYNTILYFMHDEFFSYREVVVWGR
jgi:hypothetical protein